MSSLDEISGISAIIVWINSGRNYKLFNKWLLKLNKVANMESNVAISVFCFFVKA